MLKARYLHRAYYTYVIHEITLESVQLYGHNSILSGVVGARWLPPRRAQLVGVAVDIAVSGFTCSTKITIKRKPLGNLKHFFLFF